MVERKWFNKCYDTKKYLLELVDSYSTLFGETQEDTSDLDNIFLPLLKSVIGDGDFSKFDVELMLNLLPSVHSNEELVDVVKMRWEAIVCYYRGDKNNCVVALKKAYNLASEYKTIPLWLINDIRIDIRNIVDLWNKDDESGKDAQEQLTLSNEDVHFPLLDRFNNTINSNFVDSYQRMEWESSYTISLGDTNKTCETFGAMFKKFMTAVFYGSITHLALINIDLKRALFNINLQYAHGIYFRHYIRACIMKWEGNVDEKALSNTFQERFSLITHQDAALVWESTKYIPLESNKLNGKFIALRYIGNYLDDATFENALSECLNLWVKLREGNESSVFSLGHAEKFLEENAHRMDADAVIKLVFEDLGRHINYICRAFSKALYNVDYSKISKSTLDFFLKTLATINDDSLPQLHNLLIVVRKKIVSAFYAEFDAYVKQTFPDFFSNHYVFEIYDNVDSVYDFIDSKMKIAKERNEVQTDDFRMGYLNDPLLTIRNIISVTKHDLNNEMLFDLISVIKDTIEHPQQSATTKVFAIELLTLLSLKYRTDAINDYGKSLFERVDSITGLGDGFFDIHSNISLKIYLTTLGCLLGLIPDSNLTTTLAIINGFKKKEQTEFAAYIFKISYQLDDAPVSDHMLRLIYQYALSNTCSDSNVVRHYAIRSLPFLTKKLKDAHYSEFVIMRFYEMFEYETVSNKSYLMDGLRKIDINSSVTIKTFYKASMDSNFHIRKLAKKFSEQV